MGNFVSLEEICEEFEFILVDTSALIKSLEEKSSTSLKLIDKISSKKSEICSSVFFNKYMKNKGIFYLTELVSKEFEVPENITIEEAFPKTNRSKPSKKEKKYFGDICCALKERRNLSKSFKKYNKIIVLENGEKEKYNELYRKTNHLKKRRRLSEVNFDLLITGAVLSISRGNTTILSNNFPLLYAYQSLVKNEKFDPFKYGFFIRTKVDFFSRAII